MSTPRHHTVLFDLDGTLLDTIGLILESLRFTFARHFDWAPSDAALARGVGSTLDGQLRDHARDAGVALDDALLAALVQTYREHNRAHHDAHVTAFPGAAALLESLAARDVKLGVVTSKPRAFARHGLEVCGLAGWFPVVIGGGDIPRPKPDPMAVHLALERLGSPADGTLFIGDSPHDLVAGRRAGVSTGAALWGPFDPTVLAQEAPTYTLSALADVGRLV